MTLSRYITEDVAYVSEFNDIDFERALGDDMIAEMDKDDENWDARGKKRKGTRIHKCDGQLVSFVHPQSILCNCTHYCICTLAPYSK